MDVKMCSLYGALTVTRMNKKKGGLGVCSIFYFLFQLSFAIVGFSKCK